MVAEQVSAVPQSAEANPEFMTVAQVAKRLGVSGQHVYNMCKKGKIAHTKIGDLYRITEDQLADFIRRYTVKAKK